MKNEQDNWVKCILDQKEECPEICLIHELIASYYKEAAAQDGSDLESFMRSFGEDENLDSFRIIASEIVEEMGIKELCLKVDKADILRYKSWARKYKREYPR